MPVQIDVKKSIFTKEYAALLRRLIAARKTTGMLQQELADRLNKPQSYVSKYERKERRLDVVELVMICHVLDVDVRSIVGEIEDSLAGKPKPKSKSAR